MFLSRIAAAGIFVLTVSAAHAQSLTDSVQELAKTLGQQLSDAGTQKLAIASFTELNGNATALGDFLAEELTTALFPVGDFAIIERREYDRVIAEQELYGSGGFSAEQVPEIGKQLGVDAIITGSITALDSQIRINARAISVETTRVFAAASVSTDFDNDIKALLTRRSGAELSSTNQSSGAVPQPDFITFTNEYVKAEVLSIIVPEGRREFTLTTRLTNITDELIYIANRDRRALTASTDMGDIFEWLWKSGNMTGIGVDNAPRLSRSNFTPLQPNQSINVVWKAKKDGNGPIMGSQLSVGGKFIIYIEDFEAADASISLSNINISN